MNYIELELMLAFSHSGQSVELVDAAGCHNVVASTEPGSITINHRMHLPNFLRLVIHAIDQNHMAGSNIDQSVRIERLIIDRMPVTTSVLPKICCHKTDTTEKIDFTTHWSCPSIVTIDFPQDTVIKYLLSINNKFQFS